MKVNKKEYLKLFADSNCWERFFCFGDSCVSNSKNPERLLKEIEHYFSTYKVNRFEFIDICNRDLNGLEKACDLIIQKNLPIKWTAPAVPAPPMDYGIIEKMHKAGCEKLIFSFLTGSDVFLGRVKASFRTPDLVRTLMHCRKVGITVGVDLLFGHPQETEEDFCETYNFLDAHRSLIDEISRIRYCPNYIYSTLSGISLCHHWLQCAGDNNKAPRSFFTDEFIQSVTKITSLNIPIKYCEQQEANNIDKSIILDGSLCFLFDGGKGRLFWKNRELTSGLGLYTSIFAKGIWRDSACADWQVTKTDKKKIIAKGQWKLFPIIQIWEVELKKGCTLSIKINMEAQSPTVIEGEQQINIMLKEEYSKWSGDDNSSGSFRENFSKDWVTFFERDTSAIETLKAETNRINMGLASVSLKQKMKEKGYRMGALNTSSDFNARILKCYKIDSAQHLPRHSLYFEGEISINETEI